MKILILGGTKFVGRHLTEIALSRGHKVTLFNRGQSNPGLFPEAETIIGDRNKDLHLLEGRNWDAVIDPSGYFPNQVRASAETLFKATNHYTFISSISVYNDFSQTNIDETSEVASISDPNVEEITGETYGPLKVLCEKEVHSLFPDASLIIRPGLIVGPNDPTDRFTYWPKRVYEGGEVLAPGNPNAQVQFIDVRDLAIWTLNMIEANKTGTFNATGPDYRLQMKDFLEACVQVAEGMGKKTTLHWVSEEYLLKNNVGFWIELPLWIPDTENKSGMLSANCNQAIDAGLVFRTIQDTIKDTIHWDLARETNTKRLAGLERNKEQLLLEEWWKHSLKY